MASNLLNGIELSSSETRFNRKKFFRYLSLTLSVIVFFLIILKVVLPSTPPPLNSVDVFTLLFLLLNVVIHFFQTTKYKGGTADRWWLTLIVVGMLFNTTWLVAEKWYATLGIYHFSMFLNYVLLLLGFLQVGRMRAWTLGFLRKAWLTEEHSVPEIGSYKKITVVIVLGVIILAASYLRFTNLGELSLTTDEVYNAMAMDGVLKGGVPNMPDGSYYLRGLTQNYFGAFFALFVGSNELAIRLPSALAGLGLVVFMYLIGKEIKSRNFGVSLAFFSALFPWLVEFSRWGRFYNLVTFFIVANFYLSIVAFKYRKKSYLALMVITALFAITTIEYGYFTLFTMLATFIFYNKNKVINVFYSYRKMTVGVLIVLAVIFSNLIVNMVIRGGYYTSIGGALMRYVNLFKRYSYDPYFLNFINDHLLYLSFGIALLVLFVLYSKKITTGTFLLLVVSLGQVGFISFYHHHLNPRTVFTVFPLLSAAALLGYYNVAELLLAKRPRLQLLGNLVPFIVVVGFFLLSEGGMYSFQIPTRVHGDRYNNIFYSPTTVNDYIGDTKSGAQFVVSSVPDSSLVITDHFQYFYFYAKREADYWLRPGSLFFVSNEDEDLGTTINKKVSYMSETRLINEKSNFLSIVGSQTGNVYLILNEEFGHQKIKTSIQSWLEELSLDHKLTVVHRGYEPHAVVYKIEKKT